MKRLQNTGGRKKLAAKAGATLITLMRIRLLPFVMSLGLLACGPVIGDRCTTNRSAAMGSPVCLGPGANYGIGMPVRWMFEPDIALRLRALSARSWLTSPIG